MTDYPITKDALGDRMKVYERGETAAQFDISMPVYARIDGRGFSKFTRGMHRPFDPRMSAAMMAATAYLVETTGALVGYTQSDEISLLWETPDSASDMMFSGKKQKLVSVLAGIATAAFTRAVLMGEGDFPTYAERMPHFDARVFQLPDRAEAANAFLWRTQDAARNAISMSAHHHFSHRSLQGVGSTDKVARLAEIGVSFDDYPDYFRHGVFVRRVTEVRRLTDSERARIPVAKRPLADHEFVRSAVKRIDLPAFGELANRVEVLFEAAEPILLASPEGQALREARAAAYAAGFEQCAVCGDLLDADAKANAVCEMCVAQEETDVMAYSRK